MARSEIDQSSSAPSDRQYSRREAGQEMHDLLRELFPICRSIIGPGVRNTLQILQRFLPLVIHEVPSGTRAFDWTVPKEWEIRDAYILDPAGHKVVDFKKNNLHVVGYSVPVDRWLSRNELEPHLYSLPEQPDAIPYITSYYQENWGFCLPHKQRENLARGEYRAVIDSSLKDGALTYGELILPGPYTAGDLAFNLYLSPLACQRQPVGCLRDRLSC